MDIVIDLSSVAGSNGFVNPLLVMWFVLASGGWLIFIPLFIWGSVQFWFNFIRNRYEAAQKYVLLAIDVPKENEQSPKAVEQIFAHLSGIHKRGNLKERYIEGYTQPAFSLELVSIEGYVQFLIRSPEKYRDLVEAAFYAQYPNAEISEVEDYTQPFKAQFPNEEYDIWGSELKLTNKHYYPLKTYPMFEHTLSQTFLDPMANILEIFSRLGRGEQLWFQILIEPPVDERWREPGLRLIKKLIGAKVPSERPGLLWLPTQVAQGLYESAVSSVIAPTGFGETTERKERELPSLMQHLPPNERAVVEQVGMKISKIGYVSKLRLIYLAKHDVFNADRVPAVIGALKQFNTLDLNGFAVDKKTKTKVDFFLARMRSNWRKLRRMYGYKYRSMKRGRNKFMLNVEELATLYHFPVTTVVKAPRVQKTVSKRGEPPATLPVETEYRRVRPFTPGAPAVEGGEPEAVPQSPPPTVVEPPMIRPTPPTKKGAAPENLPTG